MVNISFNMLPGNDMGNRKTETRGVMRGLTTLHFEDKPLPTVRHGSFISEHFYQSRHTYQVTGLSLHVCVDFEAALAAPLLSVQQYAETLSLSGALFLLHSS